MVVRSRLYLFFGVPRAAFLLVAVFFAGFCFGVFAAPAFLFLVVDFGLSEAMYATLESKNSLIANLGRLSLRESRKLARVGGLAMLVLWGLGLLMVFALPNSFPEWKAGSFFSTADTESTAPVEKLVPVVSCLGRLCRAAW